MTNELTAIRESSQLIEVTDFDNELSLELTSDQLSGLYGGRSAFVRRAVEAIGSAAAWDAMKYVWIYSLGGGSSAGPLKIGDDPQVLYYAA